MKYYVIAGERSGDLHAGNLLKSIKKLDTNAEIKGFGGDYMTSAGAEVSVHYRELAFMGFWEVFTNLGTIRNYLKRCKQEIYAYQPDALILVDYGGFNLKIAKYAKKINIQVFYYISPKVWAWNQNRAVKIKKRVDYMIVIMPFEKEFYKKFDFDVHYVGNPVLDAINDHQPDKTKLDISGNYVAVLPGSRKQEIEQILPTIDKLIDHFPMVNFAIAAVDNIPEGVYKTIGSKNNVKLIYGYTYDLLASAKAAIVTSGTATLETALWMVPQVVVYQTSNMSYQIAKRLIKVSYISLVNLIAGKEVVKELIQEDLTVVNLKTELEKILKDEQHREKILLEYKKLKKLLDKGRASDNAAQLIVENIKTKEPV